MRRSKFKLQPRQLDVLVLLAADLPNREIAGQLNFTIKTVRNYVWDLMGIFDVHSRVELIAMAKEMDLQGDMRAVGRLRQMQTTLTALQAQVDVLIGELGG